jgi:hypothetical protein
LTEEEKAQKIRETADAAKETKAANPQNESTRIEYYLSKGMSQREAELALSDRQRTFSLEVCIKKHGEKEGRRIWKERQSKWIGVMNSKSPEEIQDINRRKAINTNYGLIDSDLYVNIKGLFYMVSLPNDLLKFGITSRRMDQRYTKKQMDGCEVVYTMEGDLDLIAKLECLVKHDFSDKTITLAEQHGVFGFSETLRGVSAMNWQTTLNQNQKTTY